MKRQESLRNGQNHTDDTKAPSLSTRRFEQVFDGRKQRARGLWMRDGNYYGRFSATDQAGRRRDTFRLLEGATTVPAAKEQLRKLRDEAATTTIPTEGRCPTFADYARRYLSEVSTTKRPATRKKETTQLGWWIERIGALTVRQIHRAHINTGIADLAKSELSPRTVNLYVIAIRNVLKRGQEEGLIRELPTAGLRALRSSQPKRELLPIEHFERVLAVATETRRNGAEFCDYYRLLLYTGAREKEGLNLRWDDVDFKARQLTIGWDAKLKGHECRRVDFNPQLEKLLTEMHGRRAPDSQWIFPSPKRGENDLPAKNLRAALNLACDDAALPRFGFHAARHFFISHCVMAGVDFMTIARWVGHKDGGVLVGRTYGHVANEHRQKMAARVAFDGGAK